MMRRYEIVMAVETHVLAFRGFTVPSFPDHVVALSFPRGRRERKYKLSFTDTLISFWSISITLYIFDEIKRHKN